MEVGGESFFAVGIDTAKRSEHLDVVRDAPDVEALLSVSRDHFDAQSLSLGADRVLQEFRDEDLSEDLRNTEGFDPVLFKACVLFELSHLESDNSMIPEYVQSLAEFWKGDPDDTRESLERTFTAETKRARYDPFPVMSQFVILSIAMQASSKYMEEMRAEIGDRPPVDPVQEEIDGKEFRVFMGGQELKFDDPPVLTRQLQKDLAKFTPRPVLNELKYRFPDDAVFEEIQGFIERIQQERAHNVLPSDEELVSCYRRLGRRAVKATSDMSEVDAAKDFFVDVHRSLTSRLITYDMYVPEAGSWYTIQVLESDTEPNVFFRRVFYGDMTTRNSIEVPLDQRQVVLDELERERLAVGDYPGVLQEDEAVFHDVIGSYN